MGPPHHLHKGEVLLSVRSLNRVPFYRRRRPESLRTQSARLFPRSACWETSMSARWPPRHWTKERCSTVPQHQERLDTRALNYPRRAAELSIARALATNELLADGNDPRRPRAVIVGNVTVRTDQATAGERACRSSWSTQTAVRLLSSRPQRGSWDRSYRL